MRKDLKQRAFGITLSALILSSSFLAGSLIARNDGINVTAEEISVSETTAPTETTAPEETTAPTETSETAETSETEETSVTEETEETEETTVSETETETASETEETENSDIELLSLFDDGKVTNTTGLPTETGNYILSEEITAADGWTIPTGAVIDLDLNGNNLTFASGKNIIIETGASLTIHSTSNAQMNFSHGGEYVCIINNGNLTLSGNVVLYGMLTNTMWGLWLVKNVNGSFVLENSAKLIRGAAGGGGTIDSNGGTITIDGGKIENENGSGLTIKNCQFTMNNGNINVPGDIMSCDNSTVNITNSTVIGSGIGVDLKNNSTFTMDGGKLQAADKTIVVNNGCYAELKGDFDLSVAQAKTGRYCITNYGGTVKVDGGTMNGYNGIRSDSGTVSVENTTINAANGSGITSNSGSVSVGNCNIHSSRGNGITANGGDITVNDSTITANAGYGMSCSDSVGEVNLKGSTVCGTSGGVDGNIDKENSDSVFVSGSASVDDDGNVTLNGSGTVTKGGSPEVTLPQGGTVSKDGNVNAPKAQIGDTTITTKDGNIEFDDDGNIQVDSDDTVQVGDTEVTLPKGGTVGGDGNISAPSAKIGDTTVTSKDGSVEFDKDGNIKVQSDDTVQMGDTGVILPQGGTVDNSGTVTADELKVGDVTVKGEGSTISPDGNINVSDNGSVKTGDTEVTLPQGGKVDASGTVTADELKVGDVTVTGKGSTVTSDGDITVSNGGTVQTGDIEVTLPKGGTVGGDGNISAPSAKIGDTTVTSKDGNVELDKDGNIKVQSGDIVQMGDTTVTLPQGGTVDNSGTVTADEFTVGGVTVKGTGSTVSPDGSITVPDGGTVQTGDTTVTLPKGGKVDNDGKVTADELTVGNVTVTGENVTVDKDGNITLPNGGTIQNEDGSSTEISSDESENRKLSDSTNNISVEYGESIKFKDEEGNEKTGGVVSLKIVNEESTIETDTDLNKLESDENVDVVAAYDITLLYNGVTEVQPDGTVTVTIKAPDGADGSAKVFHREDSGSFTYIEANYNSGENTFSFKTSSFSIYVIAMPVSTGGGSSSGGSSGNSSGSSYRPSYLVVTETSEKKETVLVKIENAITGKKTLVNADKVGNVVTVDLGSKCNGYYANIYNENGDLIAVGVIKDNKVSFDFIGSGDISLIVDKVSYAEDVSLGEGDFSSESEIGKDPAAKTAVCVSAVFLAAAALLLAKRKHSK